MPLSIRKATAGDYATVAALNREVQQVHAEGLPDFFKPGSEEIMSEKGYAEILDNPNSHLYVGEVDGQGVGYILAEIRDLPENEIRYSVRYMHIHTLSVSAAYRSKGYGELLHRQIVELARAEGIRRIDLDVWAFNSGAHSFYLRQGFRDINYRMSLKI